MNEKQKLIIVAGPTAVGKTVLGIELAKEFYGEVVSGDSMQVYKHLDIGTAKVTKEETAGIPHHLIDILEVDESYSVADFQQEAKKIIEAIDERNRIPIVVGGTGLYIESLIYDVSHGGGSKNPAFRHQMENFAKMHGRQALWDRLHEKDPKAAKKIHPNNQQRVIRALEVIYQTDRLFSDFQKEREQKKPLYDTFIIALNTDRQLLYERIHQRIDQMLDDGLLEEAKKLYEKVGKRAPSMQGIGYKEFILYFEGEESFDEALETLKKNSRRYAKRQLTWFKNRTPVDMWVNLLENPEEKNEVMKEIRDFLEN